MCVCAYVCEYTIPKIHGLYVLMYWCVDVPVFYTESYLKIDVSISMLSRCRLRLVSLIAADPKMISNEPMKIEQTGSLTKGMCRQVSARQTLGPQFQHGFITSRHVTWVTGLVMDLKLRISSALFRHDLHLDVSLVPSLSAVGSQWHRAVYQVAT